MSAPADSDTFPVIETPRLVLREIRPEDAPEIHAIFGDPEVMRYYDAEPTADLAAAVEIVDKLAERFRTRSGIRWGIAIRNDDKLVGTCGYNSLAVTRHRAEIGYDLRRTHWKRGLMSEALHAMCAFGFDALGLHKIEARVMIGNVDSDRLLQRLGFRVEGLLRDRGFWKGAFHDLRVYGLVAGELVLNP
jgi:ribosomal-protein-alanine N-acetyltransferase